MDEIGHVVGRVVGVGVHAQDDRAPRPGNADVQSARRDALRVVDQANNRMASGVLGDDSTGTVIAHPVDDQYFEQRSRIIVGQHRVQHARDVRDFIAARDHNRDERVRHEAVQPQSACHWARDPDSVALYKTLRLDVPHNS